MRPLRIRMQAFEAYSDTQVIDFSELGEHRLFLITGPTGAGKTTLLDAICFALFGESSGEARLAYHLRSDRADAETPTEVEYDFALGAGSYKIRRRPEQPRPKARGGGTTMAAHEAQLWQTDGSGNMIRLIAEKPSDVALEVKKLLGYEADEFRQVVMLPQGKFRKVLEARPDERQAILRTLFRSTFYQRMQKSLKEEASAAKAACEAIERERRRLLADLGAVDHASASARLEVLWAEAAEAEALRDAAIKAAIEARGLLEVGRRSAEALDAVRRAEAALRALEGQLEEQASRRRRLDAALRAERLGAVEARWEAARGTAARAANALSASHDRYAKAVTAREKAEAALADEAARIEASREAAREAERRSGLLPKVQRLVDAKTRLDGAISRWRAADGTAKAAETAMASAQGEEAEADGAVRALEAVAAQTEARETVMRSAAAALRGRLDLDKALAAKMAAEDEVAQAEAEGARRRQALDAAIAARLEREAELRTHQATFLAASLESGDPCPVCGSTHHPALASASSELDQESEGRLQEALDAVERAQTSLNAADEKSRLARDALSTASARGVALAENLAEAAQANPKDLEARLAAAKMLHDEATKAASDLVAARERRDEAHARLQRATLERDTARTEADRIKDEGREARASFEVLQGDVPEEVRDLAAAKTAAEAAERRAKDLEASLDADRRAAASARAEERSSLTVRDEAIRAREEADHALEQARGEFEAKCREAGFAGPEECAAAKMRMPDFEALQATVDKFERTRAGAERTLADARKAAEGLDMPDLEVLKQGSAQADRLRDEAIREAEAKAGLRRSYERSLRMLEDEVAKMEIANRAFGVRERLSKLANGQNEHKLDLEGYVLSAHLEDALDAANLRMKHMLDGRFHLIRAVERDSKVGRAGLDIRVVDGWSGKQAPVARLSGGEGFCASLALALGLADVVQQTSGGIQVEALFIDEGFGTLDPAALDTAMRVLTELQSVDRIVGVISHVTEMKSVIGARLAVYPGARTSTAKFEFGTIAA